MKNFHFQIISVVLLIVSIILETGIRLGKIVVSDASLISGISLGLLLVAIGLNVKIVRKMGIAKKTKNTSQLIGLLIAIYAFVIYIIIP